MSAPTWVWDQDKNQYYYLSHDNYKVYQHGARVYCGPPLNAPTSQDPRYVPPIEQSPAPQYAANASLYSAQPIYAHTLADSTSHSYAKGVIAQSVGYPNQNCTPYESDDAYQQHKQKQRNRLEHNHNQENQPRGGQGPSSEPEEEEEEEEEDGQEALRQAQAGAPVAPRLLQTGSHSLSQSTAATYASTASTTTPYNTAHRMNQQQVSPSISPQQYTYCPPAYASSAQQTAPQATQNHPGRNKRRIIRTGSDSRDYETLDPRYRRVSPRHHEAFFRRGRVFMMLWTEPAGQVNPGLTRGSTHFSVVKYGEFIYAEIRRFVVVLNRGAFSRCVPIQTYRRQGTLKPGVLAEDHALIYTGDAPPGLLPGEAITKQPLKVVTDDNKTLDEFSRINFGKTYTVEHNVKVLSIGEIAPEHLVLLAHYWRDAHDF